jgi:hypothetical protein
MDPEQAKEKLLQMKKGFDRRSEGISAVLELLDEDRDFIAILRALVAEDNGHRGSFRSPGKGDVFARVKKFFDDRSNEWATAPQIIEETGITRPRLNKIIYGEKHRDLFDKKDDPDNGKSKLWRIKKGGVE